MAKKKKRKGPGGPRAEEEDELALPRVPERLSSPFKDALQPFKRQLEEEAKRAEEAKRKPRPSAPARPIARKVDSAGDRNFEARGSTSGRNRSRTSADEEATALSLAMQGVTPLAGGRASRVATTTPRVSSRTAQVAPFGKSAEDDARTRLGHLVAQDVHFRIEVDVDFVRGARADAPPRVARELARRTHVSETLDLHGLSQREAGEAVVAFLRRSHRQGLSVVSIVHGKGQHSEGGLGVLRDAVVRTLTETVAAPLVYAFASAPEPLGGSGALLVELKHAR